MTQEQKEKLAKVLKNNAKWPLIIEGVSATNFPTSIILSATTPSSELGIISTENGLKYPLWLEQVVAKSKKSKKVLLVIDGLDKISTDEQEKFYGIIKYCGINGYKLPVGTQIIIPIPFDAHKYISKKISSLTILHKVD